MQVAADDDTWNPFEDPEGGHAPKSVAARLTENERRILHALDAGNDLREIEVDRLVSLGFAARDMKSGAPALTTLGRDVLGLVASGSAGM